MRTNGDDMDVEARPAVPKDQRRPAKKAPGKQAAPSKPTPPADSPAAPPDTSQVQIATDLSRAQLLDSIYFAQNGFALEEAAVQLEAVASFAMRSDSKGSLLITGHADPAESSPHELSLRRATAVQEFLIERGVPRARIKTEALGAAHPSTGAMAQPTRNQRVEIRCIAR